MSRRLRNFAIAASASCPDFAGQSGDHDPLLAYFSPPR
jgi:hypothetical protein